MRDLLSVLQKYVALVPNPVHVELGYRITYLRGDCPLCGGRGAFVVLLDEVPRRFICRSCLVGGTEAGAFLRALLARRGCVHSRIGECVR